MSNVKCQISNKSLKSKSLVILSLVIVSFVITPKAFAVPLGGKGAMTREMIKGEMHISGLLSVEGITSFNKLKYSWPISQQAGTYLKNEGSGKLSWAKEISPGGSTGNLQFNDKGSFAGDGNLLWDNTAKTLKVSGLTVNNAAAETLDAKKLTQGGTAVSLSGHTHSTNDITGPLNFVGLVRSDKGFNVNGLDGVSGTFTQVTDMRLNGATLQKKIRTITISGGIITNLGPESDWVDAGSIPVKP